MSLTTFRTVDRTGGLNRRDVLRAAMLGTAAAAASSFPAPVVHADDPITLRYAGTGVNAFKELADKCKEDTGITIQYTTLTSDDVVKRAVTQPTSFDMLDAEFSHVDDDCTFETLTKRFAIRDKAVQKIGEMIHDADLDDEKFQRTECIGIDRVLKGWAREGISDQEILRHGLQCFDGLYAFLRRV